jgi:hypothetical protein
MESARGLENPLLRRAGNRAGPGRTLSTSEIDAGESPRWSASVRNVARGAARGATRDRDRGMGP